MLIFGSLDWDCRGTVLSRLAKLPLGSTIVHLGTLGACHIVDEVALKLGIPTVVVQPDFVAHGAAASIVRNEQIVNEIRPDFAIWFRFLKETRSVYDLVIQLSANEIPLEVVT